MDKSNKAEWKAQKKAYKTAMKKAVRPWSILTGIFSPLMVIFIAAAVLVGMFDKYCDQPRLNAEYALDAIRQVEGI